MCAVVLSGFNFAARDWDGFGTRFDYTIHNFNKEACMPIDVEPLTATTRAEYLFIVRMWQEPGQPVVAHWRGYVEHVPSGQRLYFTSLTDLNDFIGQRLTRPASSGNDTNQL